MEGVFGRPNEGFHAARVGGYALFDVAGTVAVAVLASRWSGGGLLPTLLVTFTVAQAAHMAFGVETAFVRQLRGALL